MFHICFFDDIDERNAMVMSISHFDNFIKWIILVVNRSRMEISTGSPEPSTFMDLVRAALQVSFCLLVRNPNFMLGCVFTFQLSS
jgi:hypothetical protein